MSLRALLPVLLLLGVGGALLVAAGTSIANGEAEEAPTGPHLSFDVMEHDFGQVGQEEELTAEFAYRNDGDERVVGIRAIGDCGCYGVTLSHAELAPGEEGALKVNFRTLMFSGRISKRLRVLTGNGPRAPITIRLKVDVVAGVILEPGRIWFGDVLVGDTPSQTVRVKWHEEAGREFEISAVEVPGYDFDIDMEEFHRPPWHGTEIRLAFKEAPPLGIFSATALLRTDHPDYANLSLPVTANVTGKVWLQSRTVYFGWIPKGRPKKTSILVRPFAPDVDLGTVTAKSRKGRVDVTVEKHPMGRAGWWRLLVSVPEDAEVGKLDDVVEVRTSVPGEEVTEIEVRGEVLVLGD